MKSTIEEIYKLGTHRWENPIDPCGAGPHIFPSHCFDRFKDEL